MALSATGAVTSPSLARGELSVAYFTSVPEYNQLVAGIFKQYQDAHPDVKLEPIAAAGTDLKNKVLTMFTAGTPPDLMMLSAGIGGGAPDLAARGQLLKLDDRLKQDTQFNWNDFWPAVHQAGQYQRAQVALAHSGIAMALTFYNKDLFAAAGQRTPAEDTASQNWTWQTLVDRATHLTKREASGTLDQAGMGYPWVPIAWVTVLLRCYGADYMNADGTKVVIDSPEAIQALTIAQQLGPQNRTMPLPSEGASDALVRAGRVAQAMYWMAASLWWRSTPITWDVAATPAGPAGQPAYGNINPLVIAASTKQPDVAWSFASFTLAPSFNAQMTAVIGTLTLRQSAIPQWEKLMLAAKKPANLTLIETAAKALQTDPLRSPNPHQADVDQIFTREFTALLQNGKPPDQVVKTISADGNALLGAS